jgi:hypothetical protein
MTESCTHTNLTFLQQSVTALSTSGRRMAVSAAVVVLVLKACVPYMLRKLRMERRLKSDQGS